MKLQKFNKIFNKIILENVKDIKISTIFKDEIWKLVDKNQIENENPKIKNFDNLTKLIKYRDDIEYYVVKDLRGKIKACAGCRKDSHNSYYINELLSFRKGYGSLLLHYLLALNYDIVYLNSNWEEESLNDYYRRPEFELTETTYKRDDGNVIHYFYLNKNLNDNELQEFIKNNMK